MNYSTGMVALVAAALTVTALPAFAQGKGGGGGGAPGRQQQVDRDRTYDRDRLKDRDQVDAQDRDRDRDRDQLHVQQDPSQLKDQEIYGYQLMNEQERNQYREQLQAAKSSEEQTRMRAEHHRQMQERANQKGLDLVPPGQGPVYGGEIMTVQERNEYREQLRLMDSSQQKQKFMAEHQEKIRTRAASQGVELEEVEEAE